MSELPVPDSVDYMAGHIGQSVVVVYDGECPFCSRYVKMVRLREAVGKVTIINARNGGPVVEALRAQSYDLDEGMVLMIGERIYHGAACIHILAMLSSSSGLFNRVNAAVFKSETVARILYPVLRFGRNMTLRLLSRSRLSD